MLSTEAVDKGDSQYLGDENGCRGLEEGNRSVDVLQETRFLGLAIGIG
jgi:hypothetical protein